MTAEEPVQVHVVERGLDLVHHVEGRRPGAEHREQERQRGQRALATGEQRQPRTFLPDGRASISMPVLSMFDWIGEHEAARLHPGTAC